LAAGTIGGARLSLAQDVDPNQGTKQIEAEVKEKNVAKWDDPETTRVYVIPVRGQFGQNVTATPLKRALNDAKKEQPDVIMVVIDCTFTINGQTYQEWATGAGEIVWQSNALPTAGELSTLFHEGIRDDAEWKTRKGEKPRIVAWVKHAMGPATMFAMSFREIYMAEGAHLGGVGYLDQMMNDDGGSQRVLEKWRGARLGRFTGLLQLGGYPEELARAMARSDTLMSVDFQGGKPVFREDLAGEIILADGADETRRDTLQDLVRMKGNDVLTMDAELAKKLGVSKGTVNSEDEMVASLGIERTYAVRGDRAAKEMIRWSREVAQAEQRFAQRWREFNQIQVNGQTATERNAQRGKRLGILNQIKRDLEMYKESINPQAIRGAPQQWVSEINVIIERLKTEMRLDR
jgi:hypothetical protein